MAAKKKKKRPTLKDLVDRVGRRRLIVGGAVVLLAVVALGITVALPFGNDDVADDGPVRPLPGDWDDEARLTMERLVGRVRQLEGEIRDAEAREEWLEAYQGYQSVVFMVDIASFDAEKLLRLNGVDVEALYERALACEDKVPGSSISETLTKRRKKSR